MRTNMSSKHLAIIVLAVVIVFLLPLSSCSHKQKKETPEETPIEEEMGEAGCDFDKGEDLFCNFLSADQFPQDAFFADMVEAYNSFVLLNGLYSIRDKWRRYECSEEAVASLKYADISKIKSKDLQKKFSACLALGQQFFSEHQDYSDSLLYRQLSDSLYVLDSTLKTRFHVDNYTHLSEEKFWQAVDFDEQSKDLFDKVSIQEITPENIHTSAAQKDIEFILQSIQQEQDFNKKCAYAMNYVYYVGFYNTDIGIIENLLDDERYSPHLFFLWRIWRCSIQLCNSGYGPSTWSAIPNKLYNEKRLKIAEVTLKHIATHRDDAVAINQFLMTAAHPNILRIGDFPVGNESFTELHCLDLGTR